jgi:hypothetical protein
MNNKEVNTNSEVLTNIDNLIKNKRNSFKYSLSDVILFLLYSDKRPIQGKTKQMKEVFLVLQEVLDKQDIQPIKFEKHKFGPYSEVVEYVIDQLLFSNYILTRGKKTSNDFSIEITPKGKEYIKEKFNELPTQIQNQLKRKRDEWDTLTSKGILKLVYEHYPEYLENAILKKRYERLNWDTEN